MFRFVMKQALGISQLPYWGAIFFLATVNSLDGGASVKESLRSGEAAKLSRFPPPLSHHYLIRLANWEVNAYDTLFSILSSPSFARKTELRFHVTRYITTAFPSGEFGILILFHFSFTRDYETSSALVSRSKPNWATLISENPLLIFRMIFRLVVDLPVIEAELGKSETKEAEERLGVLKTSLPQELKPNWELLEDTMERLLLVIHTYDLEVSNVASGVFQHLSTEFKLERRHCLELGKYASRSGYHALAVEWIQFVLETGNHAQLEETQSILEQVVEKVRQ